MSQGVMVLLAAVLCLSACTSTSSRPPEPATRSSGQATTVVEAVEQGMIGRPALLYFHARGCEGCQRVSSELAQIVGELDGQVEIVAVDMDSPAAATAMQRYQVTAPPTFVMVATDGTALAQVSGWPGREPMEQMLVQLAAEAP